MKKLQESFRTCWKYVHIQIANKGKDWAILIIHNNSRTLCAHHVSTYNTVCTVCQTEVHFAYLQPSNCRTSNAVCKWWALVSAQLPRQQADYFSLGPTRRGTTLSPLVSSISQANLYKYIYIHTHRHILILDSNPVMNMHPISNNKILWAKTKTLKEQTSLISTIWFWVLPPQINCTHRSGTISF